MHHGLVEITTRAERVHVSRCIQQHVSARQKRGNKDELSRIRKPSRQQLTLLGAQAGKQNSIESIVAASDIRVTNTLLIVQRQRTRLVDKLVLGRTINKTNLVQRHADEIIVKVGYSQLSEPNVAARVGHHLAVEKQKRRRRRSSRDRSDCRRLKRYILSERSGRYWQSGEP